MKRLIYVVISMSLSGVFGLTASGSAFSLKRKKHEPAATEAKANKCPDTLPLAECMPGRFTDAKTFAARNRESLLRLRENLGAISSSRNDAKLRHYFAGQTMGLLDIEADSTTPVKVCSATAHSTTVRFMPAVEFMAYLEKCTDSVPHLTEVQIPAFADGGFEISEYSVGQSELLRDSAGDFRSCGPGSLQLRCYWESTVYGYEPSPRFGGLVVTMLPGDRLQQKLEVKTDTIDGQVLPVYIPTL